MKKYILIMSIVVGLVGCKGGKGSNRLGNELLWRVLINELVEDNKSKQEGTVQSPQDSETERNLDNSLTVSVDQDIPRS